MNEQGWWRAGTWGLNHCMVHVIMWPCTKKGPRADLFAVQVADLLAAQAALPKPGW